MCAFQKIIEAYLETPLEIELGKLASRLLRLKP